ncbi:MAG: hypothetical protein HY675_19655 [Chloroflexi bacterium]|nr:hypothetical protein [Chloroflexota bacterium]
MRALVSRHSVLLVTTAPFLLVIASLLALIVGQNDGKVVYALDDAYIHMAMAKNFVQNGVWGVTSYGFTSTSSSPLWTLLIAVTYTLAGVNEASPLVLNVVFALSVVAAVYFFAKRRTSNELVTSALLVAVIYVTPLPALIFSGMEHTLHVLLSLLFATLAAKTVTSGEYSAVGRAALLVLAMLLVATRYEGLFLVVVVGAILLFQRRLKLSLLLGLAAIAPVVLYGAISLSQGWYLLPNSLLLKGMAPDASSSSELIRSLGGRAIAQLRWSPPLMVLLASVLALLALQYRKERWAITRNTNSILQLIFVGTMLLHLQFASIGWFYRYEAYLVALALLAIGIPAAENISIFMSRVPDLRPLATVTVTCLLGFALVPLAGRALSSLGETPEASNDRYLEHVYAAEFVATYYDDSPIVLGDIGAVAFYTNARILDMYGLGSIEPIRFRKEPQGYGKHDVYAWTGQESAKIAIIQLEWPYVSQRIPDEWQKVGEWKLPRNVVFEDTRVGFFAVDPHERGSLTEHLRSFSARAPNGIVQSIIYPSESAQRSGEK